MDAPLPADQAPADSLPGECWCCGSMNDQTASCTSATIPKWGYAARVPVGLQRRHGRSRIEIGPVRLSSYVTVCALFVDSCLTSGGIGADGWAVRSAGLAGVCRKAQRAAEGTMWVCVCVITTRETSS